MPDFSHLMQLHVADGATAELTLSSIQWPDGSSPTLIGRYAGESNRPYFNAAQRALTKSVRRSRSVDASLVAAVRARDLDLFPKHVLTGWRSVIDASGAPVAFTAETATDFLAALPSELFDEIRGFFGDRGNFTDGLVSTEEALDKGKS